MKAHYDPNEKRTMIYSRDPDAKAHYDPNVKAHYDLKLRPQHGSAL
jgi:hypothetical protein